MTNLLTLLSGLLIPVAHASSAWSKYCKVFSGNCSDGAGLIEDAAGRVAMMALGLIGGAAVISVIIAGIKLSTSGLNESGREQAKTVIQYAIMGLVLGVGSWSIVQLIYNTVSKINNW